MLCLFRNSHTYELITLKFKPSRQKKKKLINLNHIYHKCIKTLKKRLHTNIKNRVYNIISKSSKSMHKTEIEIT